MHILGNQTERESHLQYRGYKQDKLYSINSTSKKPELFRKNYLFYQPINYLSYVLFNNWFMF